MTNENKELLSKDLCARLPYGVKIKTEYFGKATLIAIRKNISYGARKDLLVTYDISNEETPYQGEERIDTISKIKPYLFPLSSMTEEQKKEYNRWKHEVPVCHYEYGDIVEDVELFDSPESFEYLIANHFDYYGLIPMGLAIDATNLNIY